MIGSFNIFYTCLLSNFDSKKSLIVIVFILFVLWKYISVTIGRIYLKYLENGVSKSIVHVIKHANFQL